MQPRRALVLAIVLASSPSFAHDGASRTIELLDQRIALHPRDPSLLLSRAEAKRRSGDFTGALRDLADLEAEAPGSRDVSLERGLVRAESGDENGALEDLDAFLSSGPPARLALVTRARLLEARGRLRAARADLDAALRLGMDPDVVLARGRVDEALLDFEGAAAGYEEGLLALSGAVTVRLSLVRVELLRGRHQRALEVVDEILPFAQARGEWLLLRADILAAAGRRRDAHDDRTSALRETEALLRERPSDLRQLTRVQALAALGRRDEARQGIDAVLRSSPGLVDAVALRDRLRAQRGAR